MNKTFSIKRFGKYFAYDLQNAKNFFGLSVLINGCLPIVFFIFYQIIYRLATGVWGPANISNTVTAFTVALITSGLTAPIKLYGGLTDKRIGSDWLMIPASSFEKWLSMVLIMCVVLPFCLAILLFGTDSLLGVIFPASYGTPLLAMNGEWRNLFRVAPDLSSEAYASPLFLAWLEWCDMILVFTLGAIIFKRGKLGKTFLCLIAIGFLAGMLALIIFGHTSFFSEEFIENITNNDPERFVTIVKFWFSMIYVVCIGAVLGGLYARIRTMKH